MHSLTHTKAVTFCQAETIVLVAACKNPNRYSQQVQGHTVTFQPYGRGEMQATVRNMAGVEVAKAIIDKKDI